MGVGVCYLRKGDSEDGRLLLNNGYAAVSIVYLYDLYFEL